MDLTTNQCPKCGYEPSQEFAEFECCINCGSLLIERPIIYEAKPPAKIVSRKMALWIGVPLILGLVSLLLIGISMSLANQIDILYLIVVLAIVNPIAYLSFKRRIVTSKRRLKRAVEEVMAAENSGAAFFMWIDREPNELPIFVTPLLVLAFLFIEFFSFDGRTLFLLGVAVFTVIMFYWELFFNSARDYNNVFFVSENGIERRTINKNGEPDILSIRWGEITRIKVSDYRGGVEGGLDQMIVTLFSGYSKIVISNSLTNSDEFFRLVKIKAPPGILGDTKIAPFSCGKPIKKIADL